MAIFRGSTTPGIGSTVKGNASDVLIEDAGSLITADNVEDALQEIQTTINADEAGLAAHLADTVDAHDASAISNVPAGNIVATTVQAAIDELDTEKLPLITAATADGNKDDLRLQVNGITALKALAPVSGERVYLTYHTTEGDGGHGVFRGITGAAPGTYTDDNGYTILQTGGDGSTAWVRETHVLHSSHYGLIGDDSTDNTASGQAMLNAANTLGLPVKFGKGTFKGNWEWPTGVIISGEGIDDTILRPFVDAAVFDVAVTTSSLYMKISGLTIQGSGAFTSQDGILLNTTTASTFVDTISVEGPLRITACGRRGINAFGTSVAGPFVQRLVMQQVTIGSCIGQGFYIGDYVYETTMINCWQFGCGSGTSPANYFGGRRVTWVSGGNNQLAFQESVLLTDANITTGTNILTSASNPFVIGDVGKTVAVLDARPLGGVLITTIAGYTDPGTVTLADNATATVTAGNAIIRMIPMSAPLNEVAGDEVHFINVDMEEASVYVKTTSGARNVSIFGGRFGSTKPAFAAIVNGTAMEGISMRSYTLQHTGGMFYVVASVSDTGVTGTMANARNVHVDSPICETGGVLGTVFFRSHRTTIATGTINIVDDKHAAILVDTEAAAATDDLDSILDYDGGTSRFYNGQKVTISPANGTHTVVVKHGTGNIELHSQLDFSMATSRDILELQWFSEIGKWLQVGKSDAALMSAFTPTNVVTDRSYDANATTLDEIADVLGTLIADLQSKNYIA